MKVGHLELFVSEPHRSRFFYESLGFELLEIQGDCIWLKLADAEILLRPGRLAPSGRDYREATVGIVLYTEDLPGALHALEKRGLVPVGNDGPNCPTFTDPDGHWFQLVDPRNHT
ncbi:MAG TPA: VOC family protein [Candidatus Kapabacteria bacterium]|nr:VOC family protein [Candidatus Kapabacteria bacterium]